MEIRSAEDFDAALKDGPYTSVGSYPLFFLLNDGEVLSFAAAKENAEAIRDAIRVQHGDWWVVAADINWEDHDLRCAETGEHIPAAY